MSGVAENDGAGIERVAGGRRAGREWGAGITEIVWSAEQLSRPSSSAHMVTVLFRAVY